MVGSVDTGRESKLENMEVYTIFFNIMDLITE